MIVHRALISGLGLGNDGLSPQDIERIGETADIISAAERRAMAAERDTVDRMIAKHLASRVEAVFAAKISGVTRAGLFVALNDRAPTALCRWPRSRPIISTMKRPCGRWSAPGPARPSASATVSVRLVEAAPVSGGLRFEMVSAGRKGTAPGRRARLPTEGRQERQSALGSRQCSFLLPTA